MNIQEIKIGEGLGDIKFGMSKEDLIKIVGDPTESDIYNASGEEDGYLTESWHYDDHEFSVSFDQEDNWRLTTISTSSPECKFKDVLPVGKSIDHIMALLADQNMDEPELEDLSDENINQKLLSFLSSSLNLWFEDDNLTEIQWGVLWSDEDTPKWP